MFLYAYNFPGHLPFDKAIGDGCAYERQKYAVALTWNWGFDMISKA